MHQTPALPPVHISIVQPVGYLHSLGFLDPARYVRHQLRRFGVEVTLAKNRLREDAVNLVFGAHLGFPMEWRERHACLFVNLEQLGPGGANVSSDYLQLLRGSGVIDYDLANVGAYGADPVDVPLLPFLHAPYLEGDASIPLEERPIDLLFIGSMNDRRRAFIERVEACGVVVSVLDQPLYGPERDQFIRQAKAILNCHHYESARFEQVRAQQCLSLGTPVISERRAHTAPSAAFEDAVTWLRDGELERFFRHEFKTPAFYAAARAQLASWKRHDPVEAYADLMAFAAGYLAGHARNKPQGAWQPNRINLGSGKDYKPGWLNLDILDRTEPDLILDLGVKQEFPLTATTRFGLPMELHPGSVDHVNANNVLEHVPDLPCLMTNLLTLLKEGGELEIEVPYEKALTAWQDPTHLRALNENSWLYYTSWFWYLGWFNHRFEIARSSWLDSQTRPCSKDQAAFMKLTLRKIETTPHERTVARAMQPDFGGLDADEDWATPPKESTRLSATVAASEPVQALGHHANSQELADGLVVARFD